MKLFTRKPLIYELFKEIRAEQEAIERRVFYKMVAENMKLEAFSEYRELPAPSGDMFFFYTPASAQQQAAHTYLYSPAQFNTSKAN